MPKAIYNLSRRVRNVVVVVFHACFAADPHDQLWTWFH
jgi:hypothetical protein